jgi:hypothetical protein
LFGGRGKSKEAKNDLWFIYPNMSKNSKRFHSKNFEYVNEKKKYLSMKIVKVNPKGRPPFPRYLHSTKFFNNYLAIFGGRNDDCYFDIGTSALNDLSLFDLGRIRVI